MGTVTRERLESDIAQLSLVDQLWLMERLAQRIRQTNVRLVRVREMDLRAMADDPAIQRELREIALEFAVTEMDGLEDRQP